jgi:MATE family multidrug resistance protein
LKSVRKHIKETLQLAYPVAIGQIGYVMMGVVDSAMVGQIGYNFLAAASLANGLFFLTLVVGIGISYAVTPLMAISIGSNSKNEFVNLFKQSFYINFITGIVLVIATYFFADIIYILNQPEEISELAVPYTRILGFSLLPIMIFQSYKQFIEGMAIMRPAMIITILANFVNLFANWVYIYGNLGFPRLELNGAGFATLTSRTFMMLVLIFFLRKSRSFSQYNLRIIPIQIDKSLIKRLLKLGIPSGLQYFFEAGAFTFAAFMIGWLSAKDLAAHQIAISIASMTYMVVLGISSSSAIRVGNAVGARNINETRKAGFTALSLSAIFMLSCAVILIIFNDSLPLLFVDEIDVIKIASSLLLIAAFFQLFDGVQAVGLGVLRGITDVKYPTAITFISYWIIGLPLGYFLGFTLQYGVAGVWIGLSVGLATSASLLTLRFNSKSREVINFHR